MMNVRELQVSFTILLLLLVIGISRGQSATAYVPVLESDEDIVEHYLDIREEERDAFMEIVPVDRRKPVAKVRRIYTENREEIGSLKTEAAKIEEEFRFISKEERQAQKKFENMGVQVSPLASRWTMNVHIPFFFNKAEATITDKYGNKMDHIAFAKDQINTTIDISSLESGNYYITLDIDGNTVKQNIRVSY